MYHIVKTTNGKEKILDSDEDFNKLVYWYNTLTYEYQYCNYCIKDNDKIIVKVGNYACKNILTKEV